MGYVDIYVRSFECHILGNTTTWYDYLNNTLNITNYESYYLLDFFSLACLSLYAPFRNRKYKCSMYSMNYSVILEQES